MNAKIKALILAAGKGVRMFPLTNEIPKAMVEVAGKPFLERIIDMFRDASIKKVVIIVGYKKEKIMEYFGSDFNGMKIEYIVQEKQLGTANAIGMAKQYMQSDFISINSDVLVESSLIKRLVEKSGYEAVMVGRRVKDISRFGAIELQGGLVREIIEKPQLGETETDIANAAVYRFSREIFDAIAKTQPNPIRKEYEITDSLKIMLNESAKIACLLYDGFWIDISSLQDLNETNKMFNSQ